ncbi:L-histidine N(alpha)-methyltransferase [Marilutibacter alkalisoli]|uniref:L-histidine N(Alpha)-methyltransferase n=1 Tax=Marilutibacter alkalisoli TaxID=2591633 RepID=A0A514BN13_9GAMM|nr:L-histidine N(alpha)-methyltransferase [Lysobacter alkalisoli]QDH68776.1 L-histidine N(alpha)-methyltransferase [Lysobacter alkalisoli]
MNALAATKARLTDLHPSPDDILGDALAGLSQAPKRLSSKYFYDETGSKLFEDITRQPEYYLTRVEMALLDARLDAIADTVGPELHVVEYGSGSGRKTERLLESLHDPVAYTPIEISRTMLLASTARLAERFPAIEMLPVCADFTQPVPLPEPEAGHGVHRTLVFFPGSTLGNFTRNEAVHLLRSMRATMGAQGQALVGIDLDKDPAIIEAAYNDAAGVTAAFTHNLLVRLNREIGSDFDLDGFEHRAVYARERGRIETFLVSRRAQDVTVDGRVFHFAEGEAMNVEYSHKYTEAGFAALVAEAGLKVVRRWNDPRDWFGLRLLQPA